MTSVEVQSPAPPPAAEGDSATTSASGEGGPASTYEWLASVPLLSSAGNTVYSWYEGSKNYTRASKYALDSVESSVKYVADTAAPVVKRPMTAVDSFAVKQLVKLEEKVPSIKTETEDVFEALGEQKDAVYTRISSGKDAITGRLAGGKDAITSRLASGKDAISTSLQSGKEAVYSRIQAGSEAIANTRAGCLVGSGVDRTLQATENIVDYLLPEDEKKKEESGSPEVKEGEVKEGKVDASSQEAKDDSSSSEESEGEEEEEGASRVGRVKNLSRKVKLRIYYRTLHRLDTVQQQCKSALEQLKLNIDLLKMAHSAKEGIDKQYRQLQSSLKCVREQLGSLVVRSKTQEPPTVTLLEESEEKEEEIESLTPTEKATLLQGALDYAKQLSEKVFTAFQSVSKATTYLPHHLKTGATQAYSYSQELYTTLKSAKVPTDIPASVLHRTSEVVDTQLGYVHQLGAYIKSSLQSRSDKTKDPQATTSELKTFSIPDEAQDESSSESELGEPPISRPPEEKGSQAKRATSSSSSSSSSSSEDEK